MKIEFFLQADQGPFGCKVREYVHAFSEIPEGDPEGKYTPATDITVHVDDAIKKAHPKEYARFQALLGEQPQSKDIALANPGLPVRPLPMLKAEVAKQAELEAALQVEAAEAAKIAIEEEKAVEAAKVAEEVKPSLEDLTEVLARKLAIEAAEAARVKSEVAEVKTPEEAPDGGAPQ